MSFVFIISLYSIPKQMANNEIFCIVSHSTVRSFDRIPAVYLCLVSIQFYENQVNDLN